jgi:hypothetical protein
LATCRVRVAAKSDITGRASPKKATVNNEDAGADLQHDRMRMCRTCKRRSGMLGIDHPDSGAFPVAG